MSTVNVLYALKLENLKTHVTSMQIFAFNEVTIFTEPYRAVSDKMGWLKGVVAVIIATAFFSSDGRYWIF